MKEEDKEKEEQGVCYAHMRVARPSRGPLSVFFCERGRKIHFLTYGKIGIMLGLIMGREP